MNVLGNARIYYGWWILVSSCRMTALSGMALIGFSSFYPSFIDRTQVVAGSTLLLWTFGGIGLVWGLVADKLWRSPVALNRRRLRGCGPPSLYPNELAMAVLRHRDALWCRAFRTWLPPEPSFAV